ncbi:UNVERIFIED_CONTAM: hypothetical protein PYX00_005525 [Menopon gallinae]|uniref:SREBP regulating gene protein n=1 Tax=Menopon gallinae TaxID=328185 RepID=A0AAW2HRL4_9NEOP
MWFAFFMRILRKRIVLAAIFILSLTYCILSFCQEGVADFSSSDIDSDVYAKKFSNSFLWHSDNESNSANLKVVTCRNSVQGKVLIVDDRGYICSRSDVLPSGCCNTESENTRRFACDTCKSTGCCSIYEYCISCCLHPDKKHLLQTVLGKASENVLFASKLDIHEKCVYLHTHIDTKDKKICHMKYY